MTSYLWCFWWMWWDSGCNKNQQNVCENYVASATLNLCCNNLSNSDVVSLCRQWMNYVTIVVLCWTITILVCCDVGLKSFMVSVEYRHYMGSSLETWLHSWSFLHLISYNLVSSVTAVIGATSAIIASFVYLKIKEFLNNLWKIST